LGLFQLQKLIENVSSTHARFNPGLIAMLKAAAATLRTAAAVIESNNNISYR